MSRQINNWKDCRDSRVVEKFAKRSGCEVREAKGSHKVIRYKNMTQTFYEGTISTGVACQLFKFFVKAGLIGLLFCGFLHLL